LYDIASNLVENDFKNNEKLKLNEVISFTKGKKPLDITCERKDGYEKYLTIACLNNQELTYADPCKTILTDSDILMVMDGASSGNVYYSSKGIVGSTLSKIDIVNPNFISEYVFFVLKRYVRTIQEKTTGSAIPHTDKIFVGNLEIPNVDLERQNVCVSLIQKIVKNNIQNETLSQLRDTLLPKLMNGEIELDNIEI
jgi:type I restriction enzyme S subunit